jgi:hypothetical protein
MSFALATLELFVVLASGVFGVVLLGYWVRAE